MIINNLHLFLKLSTPIFVGFSEWKTFFVVPVQYFNQKTQNGTPKEAISFLETFKITYIILM